ncbi:MAG: DUF2341 domain-containing protein, partial [Chitinispirillaceae bacterium]|nr:DUF2341 domain-containing protein [Chitinispirillaceae bacterium]
MYGFPLLVRLNPSNFTGFSSTLAQGADVRFAKPDNTPLPYEIERWIDGGGNSDTAEIWVRVDTVLGNNSSQYILMYWGKSGVNSRSNGRTVFDTGNGFAAVYHLKENQNNGADATWNNYTAARMGTPVQSIGIAGYSQSFGGSGTYYKTNSFDKCNFGSVFSISAWVYLPSSIASPGALWSKGSDDLTWSTQEVQFYLGNNTDESAQQGRYPQLVGNRRNWMNGTTTIGTDAWHHLTFVYRAADNTRQMYIDGGSITLNQNYTPYSGGTDNPGDLLFIGRDISGEAANDFRGVMDEVVVANVVRSTSWIKLCFENQKTDQTVISFQTIDSENYATWTGSQRIYLNTSSSGANIPGNVYEFPILIRLNPSLFKGFSQVLPGGADIRFAKSSGEHLPYEIERWVDGPNSADTAELWVKVDTVNGNSSQQYITMYWGKSGVTSRSDGAAVFPAGYSFQGVWHLNENPGSGAGAMKDRTVNGSHGTAQNNLTESDATTGIIGRCLNFDGPNVSGGDWLRLPNAATLDNAGNMVVSCWFRMTNGTSTEYYGIAGKYAWTGSNYSGYTICRADNQYLRFIVGDGSTVSYIASDNAVADNAWHHVVGAVYSGNLYMFVDGRQQGAVTAGSVAANQNYGSVGRQDGYQDYRYFVGDIDEVRVSRVARPSNWIRLCYENQRADQKLVSIVTVDNENYATWPYLQNLYFNTSSSGANVAGNVTNFPVLIRLNPGIFKNFSQTQPGGSDIRFAKANGVHLPYEIERWTDGTGNNDTADIWIDIDTVLGNSTTQCITMYWGKSGVGSMANPGAVFDTAHGFAGVWHLSNNNFSDATYNDRSAANHGTEDTAAIVGRGRKFVNSGPDYMLVNGLMGTPPVLTISCWAKVDAHEQSGADLISIGEYGILWDDANNLRGYYHYNEGWNSISATKLLSTGWKHVTYVCNPAIGRQQVYINGVADGPAGTSTTPIYYSGQGSNTYFGSHANGITTIDFGGVLDEVRIDKTARSADWIKLSFENQKKTQTLVSFALVDNENYATWPYFQKIYLNTSSTGANVSEMVTAFPVLIRLNPSIFKNFSQTLPGGADVRFAMSNGTHLPYEIERWVDGSNNNDTAEIWVKVDTVFGNNSQQFILMYWGKSGVASRSNGNAVFGSDNSFQGVWHLNESPVGANSIKDRTANGNHGSPQNSLSSTDLVNGVVGKSLNFDGPATAGGDYVGLPASASMDNNGNMSISSWFRLTNSGSTDYYGIAGKFSDSAPNYFGYLIGRATSQRVRFVIGNGSSGANMFVESNGTVIDNNWHHAAGIVTSGTLNLYLDGVRQSATATGTPVPTGDYATIGRRAGNLDNGYFMGDIDEVRFSSAARSAEWIKLCFENQKPNQTLVTFTTGDTEDYATWPYSQKIYINTAGNGASIAGTVIGFPLLFRLNPSTFKGFASTLAGGADVRFASSGGAHLPYEIERWIDGNSNNDTAEVWIRVDTIRGNSSSQYIIMYWGKSGSTSRSSSREVFDITRGFVTAYHLGESSGNALDATANALHAVPRGALPNRSEAVAGYGGRFNGAASYYNAGNDIRFGMSSGNTMTISAWVNRQGSNATRNQLEGIAGKYQRTSADAREFLLAVDTTPNAGLNFLVSSDGTWATATVTNSRIIPQRGSWYHVAGTMDGSLMRIFVNGVQQASSSKTTIFNSLDADFRIGICDSQSATSVESFNGRIDEVVLSRVARSPDWLKLCFETQKPGQTNSVIPEHVASPVIRDDTPVDMTVTEGDAVAMAVSATGIRPFAYRWYKNNVLDGDSVPGQTDSILRFPSAQSTDGGRYLCVVSNAYGKDTSRPALLTIEPNRQISNPLIIRGTFIDTTHVRLSISRYAALPDAPTPLFPWSADSVWVWYKANAFPSAPLRDDPDLLKFPLSTFRQNAADQYDTVVSVRKYPTTTCYYYCFLGSVYWNNTAAQKDSLPPFADPSASGAMVYMCDTSALSNPLRFSFDCPPQTD